MIKYAGIVQLGFTIVRSSPKRYSHGGTGTNVKKEKGPYKRYLKDATAMMPKTTLWRYRKRMQRDTTIRPPALSISMNTQSLCKLTYQYKMYVVPT